MTRLRDDRAARCRTCRAEIFFARNPNRKLVPLDVDDVPAAGLSRGERWRFDEAEQRTWLDPSDQGRAFILHFRVCPATTTTRPADPVLRVRWEENCRR